MLTEVGSVAVLVTDANKAAEWYRQKLGAEASERVTQAAKGPSRTSAARGRLFRADRLTRRSTADRTSSLSPSPRRPPMDLDDRNLVLGGPRQQSALKSLTVPASEFCERNDSPDNGTVLRAQSVHHSIRRFRVMGPGEGGNPGCFDADQRFPSHLKAADRTPYPNAEVVDFKRDGAKSEEAGRHRERGESKTQPSKDEEHWDDLARRGQEPSRKHQDKHKRENAH